MTGDPRTLVPGQLNDRRRLIRRSFIFAELEADILDRLATLIRPITLPRGATLFEQGDEGDALYAVASGLIRISVAEPAGRELTFGLMETGDVFGEIALLDGLPRTATASAAEDCELLALHRNDFLSVLAADHRLALHVIVLLCERLRQNNDRLSDHAFLTLRGRLARKLGELAVTHGVPDEAGVRIGLKLSQTELAQMLGVTREAVNKQLKGWSQQGLLRHERGYFILSDPAGLRPFET